MKLRKIYSFLLLLIPFCAAAQAPEIILISDPGTKTTCNAIFYDDGGGSGKHSDINTFTKTIAPSDPSLYTIVAKFTFLSLNDKDTLFIYDGPNTSSPLLAISPDMQTNFLYKPSKNNSSGALTFKFKPKNDSSYNNGWVANINCDKICYDFDIEIDYTNPDNATNNSYLNICKNEPIQLTAKPIYSPPANPKYQQSEATTTYQWIIDREKTINAASINHTFLTVQGHELSVILTDNNGCTERKDFRIQISNPKFDLSKGEYSGCEGTELVLKYGTGSDKTTKIIPTTYEAEGIFGTDNTRAFIPHGPYSGDGDLPCANATHVDTITFKDFIPGSTITKASDITSICLNVEKEGKTGLSVSIECPNGKTTSLKKDDWSSNQGDNDLGNPYDGSLDSGDPDWCYEGAPQNRPGTGDWYCWSEIYPNNGTITNPNSNSSTNKLEPTNRDNRTNYYLPEPFNGQTGLADLIGCPLNGNWIISVGQESKVDGNGWVFGWNIEFASELMPGDWNYTAPITNIKITDASGKVINAPSDSTFRFTTPDRYDYTFTVTDEFGCSSDTLVRTDLLEMPKSNIDTLIYKCEGQTYVLDPKYYGATQYKWTKGSSTNTLSTDSVFTVEYPGKYNIKISNSNNDIECSLSKSIFVEDKSAPIINLGEDTCSENGSFLLEVEQNPGYTYLWNDGDNKTSKNITQTGYYSIAVSTKESDCVTRDTIHVRVFDRAPIIDKIEDSYVICSHQTQELNATATGDKPGHIYKWSIADTNIGIYKFKPLTPETKDYNIIVTKKACSEITKNILIHAQACEVFPPAAFTPNGDNINDFLTFNGLDKFEGVNLVIFNRWGHKVYENNNYKNNWNGDNTPAGTYFYILTFPEELKIEPSTGSFSIINDK